MIKSVPQVYRTAAILFFLPIPVGILERYITNRTVRVWFMVVFSLICQLICFDWHVLHTIVTIFCSWVFINYLPYPYAHYINLAFNMIYVFYGHAWRMYYYYLVYSTDWTVLQMFLVCRTTMVSFYRNLSFRDINDVRPKLRPQVITEHVDFLDFYAYCWHLPGMLIGPYVPYKEFLKYLDLSMFPNKKVPNTIVQPDFYIRLIEMIIIFQLGVTDPYDFRYMFTDEFMDKSFLWKCGYFLLCHYSNMMKYLFMFIAAEVSCVGCGICYVKDEDGTEHYCYYRTIRLWQIMTARGLRMFAGNWNLGVVEWVVCVINDIVPSNWPRIARNATTYTINAFWHGFYPGYLLFFFCCGVPYELCSKDFLRIINTYINPKSKLYYVWQVLGFICSLVLMMFCHFPFNLLTLSDTFRAWGIWYYYFYIALAAMYLLHFVIPPCPPEYWEDKKPKEEKETEEDKNNTEHVKSN